MADASQHWNLFGYDLRRVYQDWRAAWNELFWGERSWLRRSLGETVQVFYPDSGSNHYYQAGKQVKEQACKTQACVIPEHLLLLRILTLPANVELELESLLALEVRSSSPFLAEDTHYGWRVAQHDKGQIVVNLVIVSRSAILIYLHQQNLAEDKLEIWAMVDQQPVVINGFGEMPRKQRYRRQIIWFVSGIVYCFVMVSFLLTIPVAVKYLQLQKLEHYSIEVAERAEKSVALRSELRINNERANNIEQLISSGRDPYPEIERLTYLLDDGIWLSSVNIKGDLIRVEGFAKNAAALMQKLSDQPGIDKVRAPAAIRFDNRTKRERFVMELSLHAIKDDAQ